MEATEAAKAMDASAAEALRNGNGTRKASATSTSSADGFQQVRNLNTLKPGRTYKLRVMKAGTFEKNDRQGQYAGTIEWVRTEPNHREWGHIKLVDQDRLVQVDVNEWLEVRQVGDPGGPAFGMADLAQRLEEEEGRARQINRQASSDGEEQNLYWEGYMVALRKARELVEELEIVQQWVK